MEEKNIFYITKEKLNDLVEISETYFNKDLRKRIAEIEKKYGIKLTWDRQINMNLLWDVFHIKALTESKEKDYLTSLSYPKLIEANKGKSAYSNDMLSRYVSNNNEYTTDYKFVSLQFFEPSFLNVINRILRSYGLYFNSNFNTLNEFMSIGNYFSYFDKKYGIANASKIELKATEKAISFFDDLLKDVKNKNVFFYALTRHFAGEDQAIIHHELFK